MILAIESAIAGGSLSLIKGDSELAHWIGTSKVAKAEDLLQNIDQLLKANGISTDELDVIAVSAGPGSFTGIRIGIATGLGLKTGLGVPMLSVSALRAMVFCSPRVDGKDTVAAVPVGRDRVCIQSFRPTEGTLSEVTDPLTLSNDEFDRHLTENYSRFVVHHGLCRRSTGHADVTDFGMNLAYAVGLTCHLEPSSARAKPLFISK